MLPPMYATQNDAWWQNLNRALSTELSALFWFDPSSLANAQAQVNSVGDVTAKATLLLTYITWLLP